MGGDERDAALAAEREPHVRAQLDGGCGASCRRVARSAARRARAGRRGDAARLDLPEARLEVALEALPADAAGCRAVRAAPRQVEFRFSANPGEAPRALRRVASGGELSRVFLALKNALRSAEAGRVLIFDEVDAGIGGRAADRVGALLAELARSAIRCSASRIWPQIAACADVQLRVVKRTQSGRTTRTRRALDAEERVEELARMAGGRRIGEATRAPRARAARERGRRAGASRRRAPPAPPRRALSR